MYDINQIRRDYRDKPKQLELINLVHKQIVKHNYSQAMTIIIPKRDFSSSLKKKVISLFGYEISFKKIRDDEIPIIKKKDWEEKSSLFSFSLYFITNNGFPKSTTSSFSTSISTTSPSNSDSISFISFIASIMQRTSPFFTFDPFLTKFSAVGEDFA